MSNTMSHMPHMSHPLVFDDYDPSKTHMPYDLSLANGLRHLDPSLPLYAGLDTFTFGNQVPPESYGFAGQPPSMFYPDLYLQDNTVVYETPAPAHTHAPAPPTQHHHVQQLQHAPEMLYQSHSVAPTETFHVPATLPPMRHSMPSIYSTPGCAPPVHSSNTSRSLPDTSAAVPPSWSLSGSLDPTTGVFQRAPEHPRLRTAQACEKCRIRKAKCSGDRPSCARCVGRGLICEYAVERKMRGPNKAKRQGIAPERRSSVVSSDSGSDDIRGFESSDIPPAVIATAPSPPQRSAVAPTQLPPSPAGHSGISMMTAPSGSLSPRRRLRPPPIDLGSAGSLFSSVQPDFMKQPMYEAGLPDFYADRRASLPAYLLESYSRVALDNDDTALLSGRSTGSRESFVSDGSSPADGFSVSSLPRSESSGPSERAPPTPLELPSSMYDGREDLLYPPLDVHSDFLAFNHGVSPVETAHDPMQSLSDMDTITPKAREERPFDEQHQQVLSQ